MIKAIDFIEIETEQGAELHNVTGLTAVQRTEKGIRLKFGDYEGFVDLSGDADQMYNNIKDQLFNSSLAKRLVDRPNVVLCDCAREEEHCSDCCSET